MMQLLRNYILCGRNTKFIFRCYDKRPVW